MDAQFQIRQNALELQSFMSELFDWEADMKKKEKKMLKEQLAAQAAGQLPATAAVRGRADSVAIGTAPAELQRPAIGKAPAGAQPPRKKKKRSGKPLGDAAHAAGHTWTHYGKWDKFDVDAALQSDSGSEYESEEEAQVNDDTAGVLLRSILLHY